MIERYHADIEALNAAKIGTAIHGFVDFVKLGKFCTLS